MIARLATSTIVAVLAACIAVPPAIAQDTEDNLAKHQNFRGEKSATLVDQKNWYRAIRSELWSTLGLSEERTLEILANVVAESDNPDIFDLDHDAWVRVWEAAANTAETLAKNAADSASAKALYAEASLSYMVASYPHNHADLASRLLEASVRNYVKAANVDRSGRVELISVKGDGFSAPALLHLPQGPGPFPVVMLSGGIDVTLVEHGYYFDKYFEPEGVAFITFDIPGGGLNQGMRLEAGETTVIHHAVFRAIEAHSQLDESRVAASSASA